jgi:hypothetical protein
MVHPGKNKTECCWPGQAWSTLHAVCVGVPKCPAGFEARGESCADLEAERARAAQAEEQRRAVAREAENERLAAEQRAEQQRLAQPATLRLRATCGADPKPIAGDEGTHVVELTGRSEAPVPRATKTPTSGKLEFVDYELRTGPHVLRVSSRLCKPQEQRLTVLGGRTFELSVKLERTLVKTRFERPAFAGAGDQFTVADRDGKNVCDALPCTQGVPLESGYKVVWSSGARAPVSASVPNTLEAHGSEEVRAELDRKVVPHAARWPLIGAGIGVEVIGLAVLFGAGGKCMLITSSASYQKACSPTGAQPSPSDFGAQSNQGIAATSGAFTVRPTGPTSATQRGIGPNAAVGVGFMVAGAAAIGVGVAMLTGWAGTDALEMRIGGRAGNVRAKLGPFGLDGTF